MTFFFIWVFILLVFWRPQEWLIPWLYGLPMLEAVFYMAMLGLLVEIDGGRIQFRRYAPHVYMIPGLWVAAILSHAAHTYVGGIMMTLVPVFKFCFFTFVLFCVLDRPSRLRGVAATFVLMAVTMSIHALLQVHRGYGFAGSPPMWHRNQVRALFFGIFEDPNDLAQMLVTCAPFSFALFRRRSLPGILVGCGVAWLLTLGVLHTHSRGGIVGLAAAGAVILAMLLPARWLPGLLITILVSGLLLCPAAAPFLDDSAHDRVVFWGEANRAFKRTPIFGVGWNMMGEYIDGGRATHNAFVLCYSELGLFGYWFWFGMIQLGIIGAWRSRVALHRPATVDQAWLKQFAGLCIASLAGYCASGYFLTRAFIYPVFFLMAITGALPYIVQQSLGGRTPPLFRVKQDLRTVTVGSVVSVAYIYFTILVLNKAYYFG